MRRRKGKSRTGRAIFPPSIGEEFEVSHYVEGQTLPPRWLPERYAAWLFEFLRTDLDQLTPGQQLGMRADLWAFVQPELVEPSPQWAREGLPPVEVLKGLQKSALAGIARVREDKWFMLETGIKWGVARMGNRLIRGSRTGSFDDLFLAAVMDVMQGFWDRLHRCPRCKGIFVKVGKRKFCSAGCARRAHWDAFKRRRAERDHTREYARRVQKRLGASVKVRIRSRNKV
jgi:hypothetical protein